jgi:hypothetical protein
MKITPEHFSYLRDSIVAANPPFAIMRETIARDSRVKDPAMRLRWDCLHFAGLSPWICDNLYSYADDSHIDTALRAIMREIEA